MRVIVICEMSGVVSEAFRKRGHDAWSLDLLPTEGNAKFHYQEDMFSFSPNFWRQFKLGIAFPDCTPFTVSGNGTYAEGKEKHQDRIGGVHRINWLWKLPIKKFAIENPIGVLSSLFRKPSQYINPWEYGHGETKKTCIWSRNLPLLVPTKIVSGREQRIWKMGPSPTRKIDRSRTYPGWANAMAQQWG